MGHSVRLDATKSRPRVTSMAVPFPCGHPTPCAMPSASDDALCRSDEASHAFRVSTPLPVQGHDPHRVTGVHVHDLRGQVCQTHPVPTHVHGGGVEAVGLRAPE